MKKTYYSFGFWIYHQNVRHFIWDYYSIFLNIALLKISRIEKEKKHVIVLKRFEFLEIGENLKIFCNFQRYTFEHEQTNCSFFVSCVTVPKERENKSNVIGDSEIQTNDSVGSSMNFQLYFNF